MNNAGTWWLKGAWLELGVAAAWLQVIQQGCRTYRARAGKPLRVLTHATEVLVRKTETLAFLPLFEQMTRLGHLDTYTDAGLNLLVERPGLDRAATMELYLSELTRLRIADAVGCALARCYWRAWYQTEALADRHVF
jgi:hypothetical protein